MPTSKAISRREMFRRLFFQLARLELELTWCATCKGWHEGPYVVETVRHDAIRRARKRWRNATREERTLLERDLALYGAREDCFEMTYNRVLGRVKALRMLRFEALEPAHTDLP